MIVTTSDLNLRKGAGTGNDIVMEIPNGSAVTVTGDAWYPVSVAGKSGWVNGKYLDFNAPDTVLTRAQQRFPAISEKYLDDPYMWGGNGPAPASYKAPAGTLVFDCSGYSWWVMGDMGFVTGRVKHSADTQMHMFRDGRLKGTKVTGALLPGDIMFFGATSSRATHVTFYHGDAMLIGANHGNALTKTWAYAKSRNAKVQIEPSDYRKDLIEVWRPAYS